MDARLDDRPEMGLRRGRRPSEYGGSERASGRLKGGGGATEFSTPVDSERLGCRPWTRIPVVFPPSLFALRLSGNKCAAAMNMRRRRRLKHTHARFLFFFRTAGRRFPTAPLDRFAVNHSGHDAAQTFPSFETWISDFLP